MIDNHQERIAVYNFCPTSSILKFIDNPAEYQLYDKHPNEKAWDIIVPEIIKQLKL